MLGAAVPVVASPVAGGIKIIPVAFFTISLCLLGVGGFVALYRIAFQVLTVLETRFDECAYPRFDQVDLDWLTHEVSVLEKSMPDTVCTSRVTILYLVSAWLGVVFPEVLGLFLLSIVPSRIESSLHEDHAQHRSGVRALAVGLPLIFSLLILLWTVLQSKRRSTNKTNRQQRLREIREGTKMHMVNLSRSDIGRSGYPLVQPCDEARSSEEDDEDDSSCSSEVEVEQESVPVERAGAAPPAGAKSSPCKRVSEEDHSDSSARREGGRDTEVVSPHEDTEVDRGAVVAAVAASALRQSSQGDAVERPSSRPLGVRRFSQYCGEDDLPAELTAGQTAICCSPLGDSPKPSSKEEDPSSENISRPPQPLRQKRNAQLLDSNFHDFLNNGRGDVFHLISLQFDEWLTAFSISRSLNAQLKPGQTLVGTRGSRQKFFESAGNALLPSELSFGRLRSLATSRRQSAERRQSADFDEKSAFDDEEEALLTSPTRLLLGDAGVVASCCVSGGVVDHRQRSGGQTFSQVAGRSEGEDGRTSGGPLRGGFQTFADERQRELEQQQTNDLEHCRTPPRLFDVDDDVRRRRDSRASSADENVDVVQEDAVVAKNSPSGGPHHCPPTSRTTSPPSLAAAVALQASPAVPLTAPIITSSNAAAFRPPLLKKQTHERDVLDGHSTDDEEEVHNTTLTKLRQLHDKLFGKSFDHTLMALYFQDIGEKQWKEQRRRIALVGGKTVEGATQEDRSGSVRTKNNESPPDND